MLEDLKDAIIWFSDIDIGVSTLSEHAKKHIKTLITLAEAAVESEGKPLSEEHIFSPSEAHSKEYLKAAKHVYNRLLPAFALLQA